MKVKPNRKNANLKGLLKEKPYTKTVRPNTGKDMTENPSTNISTDIGDLKNQSKRKR